MINTTRNIVLRLSVVSLLLSVLFACANIGNPNGGPYDEDPPKFVSSKPAVNQLNFKGKEIEIVFDEYISIENPSENVIVTPPQIQSPIIQAVGKRIKVELRDSLKDSTTYTIDFTSSIVDSNEKNALENFSFAFSTGDVLDTLMIGGTLINASDLEPMSGIIVGIHNNFSDTAFTKTPFLRTSRTDERGRFIIHNIAPGAYNLFALEDKNRNYSYDKNNNEALAFLDTVVVPMYERAMVADTIWRDTITVDTVMMVERTLFYPNDLILWFFSDSVMPRQRMLRPERPQDYVFTLRFNAPLDTFPKPVPLNFEPADSLWYITQRSEDAEGFAVNYWILDSMIYKIDTLELEVSYMMPNDSIPDLFELQTDTLSLVNREAAQKRRQEARPKRPVKVRPAAGASEADSTQTEEPKPEPVVPLQVAISPTGTLNPYDVITVMFNEPVMDVQKEYFVMEIEVDSLWEAVDFDFEEDAMRAMTYNIKRPFKYNEQYRITIDSAMLCGVYGHCNDLVSATMSIKSEKDYGHLNITVQGLPFAEKAAEDESPVDESTIIDSVPDDTLISDSLILVDSLAVSDTLPVVDSIPVVDIVGDVELFVPAFVELLDDNGSPVRKSIVKNGVAEFIDMPAGKYYARITLDVNGNGVWDAGNYEERRQPERVIYFMNQYEVRENWKIDETWDISVSKPGEKPYELLKNKPKESERRNRDYREESKPRRSSNSGGMGLGGFR